MNMMDWFNANLAKTCFDFNLEPAYDEKEKILYIFGTEVPDQEVQEQILALIPKEQPVKFLSSITGGTKALICLLLKFSGGSGIIFRCNPDHEVILEVESSNKLISDPSSPMWAEITRILKADAFTKTIKYVINGEAYEPVGNSDSSESPFESYKEEERSMRRRPLPKSKPVPGKVNDNRFDYDREYLPEDVGRDVKILLETSDSVEEFLGKI